MKKVLKPCEFCGTTPEKIFGSGRFCSKKCTGKYGTLFRHNSEKKLVKLKCSKCNSTFEKKLKESTVTKSYKPICRKCQSEKTKKTLLSNMYRKTSYEKLGSNHRKIIKWKEQGEKCNKCGFNQYSLDDGPYQLHHIDGNRNNRNKENEEVLCCNCHYMTDNFAFKNRKHSEETKELLRGDKNGMFGRKRRGLVA